MPFIHEPPLPAEPSTEGFTQCIRLNQGRITLGTLRWHSAGDATQGVIQILDLYIALPHRRRGFGGQLLKEGIQQATLFHRAHNIVLRRVWLNVEQKTHINARAFLTGHGFHHVATIPNLFKDQDALIYMKSLD